MGKHHHTSHQRAGHATIASVRSWIAGLRRRPIPGANETACERTQPIPVVIDDPGPNERTLPLTGILIPLRHPPEDWISPAEWAHQHSGGAVQP